MSVVDDFIQKARRFLLTAEKAAEIGDYDSCASRAYYAMFFVAEAALLSIGVHATSHKGVLSLFSQHFVKTGLFSREMGRLLNTAYDMRIIGDYEAGVEIEPDKAQQLLTDAKAFVEKVADYLEPLKGEQPR